MNVTCEKCNKRYSIADDKVRGKSVKIRCKQCQNLISVQGPAAVAAAAELGGALGGGSDGQWDDERTRAMPAMDVSSQWFAMVKGKQLGPFDLRGLEDKVKTRELTLRTYLWKQGMGDWKRASDVPEVSMVFAGVSLSPTTSGISEPPPSRNPQPLQRDVASALEQPSPEITSRKSNGNGHSAAEAVSQPAARSGARSRPSMPAVAVPEPEVTPAPSPASPPGQGKPLSDLFADGENVPSSQAPVAKSGKDSAAPVPAPVDPFAALGEVDPKQVPEFGEATKFFIAQAGVNKRNPPWKIALFILGGPGLIVGVLFLLATLDIVPPVTRINEKGEEVQESFFSAGGVTGIKDIFSGEAKKRKAEAAQKAAQAAAASAARRKAIAEGGGTKKEAPAAVPDKAGAAAAAKEEEQKAKLLALVSGDAKPPDKGPRVRAEDRANTKALETKEGLSPEVALKVIGDKSKAFESCIATALRRTPNLTVGKIDMVINIGPSGAVTSANISPARHNNSDWGVCMTDAAKRIVFPKSDGETQLEVPFRVGVSL